MIFIAEILIRVVCVHDLSFNNFFEISDISNIADI